MPVISGAFDWSRGLIWHVGIADGEIDEQSEAASRLYACAALVDTGATNTCISPSVVSHLDLEPISKIDLTTAAGVAEVNVYDVHVLIPVALTDPEKPDAGFSAHIFANLRAPEVELGGSRYEVLIGLDILRRGLLNISHDGHFSFAV